jgi:hypothetical protein
VKYLALIYTDEQGWDRLSDDERKAWYERYRSFSDEAGATGALSDGAELAPTSSATTVRVRGDETIVADGPFVETKEALGGYFVLEAESMDEAVALAAKIPGAAHGAVEVRAHHVEEGEEQ